MPPYTHGEKRAARDGANHLISTLCMRDIHRRYKPPRPAKCRHVYSNANGSVRFPLYLPVPHVMICVPQFLLAALIRLSTSHQMSKEFCQRRCRPTLMRRPIYSYPLNAHVQRCALRRHLIHHLFSFHVLRGPAFFEVGECQGRMSMLRRTKRKWVTNVFVPFFAVVLLAMHSTRPLRIKEIAS